MQGSTDVLKGYRLQEVEISDKAFLAKGEEKKQLTAVETNNEDDEVNGTALELTAAELELTDQYEPQGYRRVKVRLASGKEAWLYRIIQ